MILNGILQARAAGKKLLAVLIDPDKFNPSEASEFFKRIPTATTHIFVGGSTVEAGLTEAVVKAVKVETTLPVVLFPGDHSQITEAADGILFLSLLSGRNPEFLIDQQLRAVPFLIGSSLEIIPTGYLLIDGGKETAVQRVTQTTPIAQEDLSHIVCASLAGEYLGKRLIYLEAGSGAKYPVSMEVVSGVKNSLSVPLIVGGGIRSEQQLREAYEAGADLVVMGTAFEENS